jgi:Phage integrase, N-terminal SAM-like domain
MTQETYTKAMPKDTQETESKPGRQLTVVPDERPARISARVASSIVVPAIIGDAGDRAAKRFLEFFAATIRNKNTRMAYYRACCRFFAWCDEHKLGALADIEPLHVAAYIETMQTSFEKPSVKQHLAAIRMLFDWLVTGQVVATKGWCCGPTFPGGPEMAPPRVAKEPYIFNRVGDLVSRPGPGFSAALACDHFLHVS